MTLSALRTFPGYAWPAVPDAGLAQVWVAYQSLDRTQWLAPADLEAGQLRQARVLLAHAVLEVPYYRSLFAASAIVPGSIQTMDDFRRLPLLSRETCQQRRTELSAERLPPGTVASEAAGFSKSPDEMQTNIVNLWWAAFFLRDLDWYGIDPAGTLAVIRAGADAAPHGTTFMCWMPMLEPLLVTGPAFVMDERQDFAKTLQSLQRVAPDFLMIAPSDLESLADFASQQRERVPGLRLIQAVGAPLALAAKQAIERAFAVPVRNTVTWAQTGHLASSCPLGEGWHVHAENVILEVLDDTGRPCLPGETGRAFVTTLQNFRSPFIRYELGATVTLGQAPCRCGRGLPFLTGIE